MSTGEFGAVGIDVAGLVVPGLELLPRNDDDGSVAGELLAGFVARLDPRAIDDEGAALDFVALTDRVVAWAQALHLRAVHRASSASRKQAMGCPAPLRGLGESVRRGQRGGGGAGPDIEGR